MNFRDYAHELTQMGWNSQEKEALKEILEISEIVQSLGYVPQRHDNHCGIGGAIPDKYSSRYSDVIEGGISTGNSH
jgi:hypothetical protein